MAARHPHAPLVVVLPALMVFVIVPAGCQGCHERAPDPQVGAAAREGGDASRAVSAELDTQEPTFPEDFEFGLANTRMLQFAGTMDARNRYVPTVMLSIDEPMTSPDCSGILVSPRLVLTLGAAFVRGAR